MAKQKVKKPDNEATADEAYSRLREPMCIKKLHGAENELVMFTGGSWWSEDKSANGSLVIVVVYDLRSDYFYPAAISDQIDDRALLDPWHGNPNGGVTAPAKIHGVGIKDSAVARVRPDWIEYDQRSKCLSCWQNINVIFCSLESFVASFKALDSFAMAVGRGFSMPTGASYMPGANGDARKRPLRIELYKGYIAAARANGREDIVKRIIGCWR